MAAGVASGVVALVIEANRRATGSTTGLTPNMVKAILQYSAIPVTDSDPSTPAALEQGAGGINAAGAIALARAIRPATTVGTPWLAAYVAPYTYINGEKYGWANHIVWGDHFVRGDTLKFNLKAWAKHIVWGDHLVWGDHIVWGDGFFQDVNEVVKSLSDWSEHIVWGDYDEHIVWGDYDDEHIVWGDLDDEHIVWGDSSKGVYGLSSDPALIDPEIAGEGSVIPSSFLEAWTN
jgi:hypothetical protein